jgi:hypothetical protein
VSCDTNPSTFNRRSNDDVVDRATVIPSSINHQAVTDATTQALQLVETLYNVTERNLVATG